MTDYTYKLEREVRRIEEVTGTEISIRKNHSVPFGLDANDMELKGQRFTCQLGPPSKYVQQSQAFHSQIYKARRQEVYRRQRGLCAECSRPLRDRGECDHIKTRARGGRDDRLSNLRILCSAMAGGCSAHYDKHNKGRKAQ